MGSEVDSQGVAWGTPDGVPVFIIRTGQAEAVAVAQNSGKTDRGWIELAGDVLSPMLEFVPGFQRETPVAARKFTMDPGSLAKWDTLQRHGVDGYSYGILWNSEGKIASHVQLKEISGELAGPTSTALNPAAAAQLALLVSLKQDIARLEDALAGVRAEVLDIRQFLEVKQESELLAALDTIHEVHGKLSRDGRVVAEDWARVTHLEQILKATERQVLSEMTSIRNAMDFNTVSGAKIANRDSSVSASRLEQLKFLLFHTLWAQEEWVAIMLAVKDCNGTLRQYDIEESGESIRITRERASSILRSLEELCAANQSIKGTPPLKLLTSKGLVVGWKYEGAIIKDARLLRRELLVVASDRAALQDAEQPLLSIVN